MVGSAGALSIALLSGSGGAGRTTAAVDMASFISQRGYKALLIDLCFGWGGLGLRSLKSIEYRDLLDVDEDLETIVEKTGSGFDLITCEPPAKLDLSLDGLKKISWLANQAASRYDFIIFDTPAGGHPLSLLAAGLSEQIYLFSRPDPASVAASYSLLKTLDAEESSLRVRVVFSLVDSAEQAVSLKTRFDLLTGQFLGFRLMDGGFIRQLQIDRENAFAASPMSEAGRDTTRHLIFEGLGLLQNETERMAQAVDFPGPHKAGR
jgi:flagellar biosynthesis protein FlhG